ncbi:MAG: sulfite exporter TauE/SafE family protein [Candidatus Electrothrix sp. GW3-4]|uniref:sulfite exporter TauE/SafE family protein n=1 Tax=Candidatus Electrothrix sp. GW3-4 TaxID=3126740 RepID=UPI0030CBAC1C
MYFPTADIEVQPWLPPLVAFCISFFTSMSGVSGAFLLLPFQVSYLGFDTPSVSATNHLFNITAIPGGVYRYIRDGRMAWPLTWAVIIGTLPGVLVGTVIRTRFLLDPTFFKRFIGIVLLYIGGKLLINSQTRKKKQGERSSPSPAGDTISQSCFNLKTLGFTFRGENYQASTKKIMSLSLVVGLIGGIYGIGGGALMAPFFISLFGLPIYSVAGAALMGTLVTSFAGIISFQLLAQFYPETAIAPDWRLGIMFGAGGCIGMYCGAKIQPYVPARLVQTILACSVLFIALRYLTII